MEPVGLALGAASLVFQVFAGCIKAYQLVSEAQGLEGRYQYLRIRFKAEQYRLLDFATISGLSENESTLIIGKACHPVLLDILDQQRRLILQFGRVDERLQPLSRPLICEETGEIQTKNNDLLQQRFPKTNALLERSLKFIQSTTKYPARLRWVVCDKEETERVLSQLSCLNDNLHQLLDKYQRDVLLLQNVRTQYQILQLNDKLDQLKEIIQAGSSTPLEHTTPDWQHRHGTTDRKYPAGLVGLAQCKALISAIDSGSLTERLRREIGLEHSKTTSWPPEISLDDLEAIVTETEDARRPLAWYMPPGEPRRRVWIEWQNMQPRQLHDVRAGPEPRVLERFQALATLLREDLYTRQFKAVKCFGYCTGASTAWQAELRYGLVLGNPSGVGSSCEHISLLKLLEGHDGRTVSLSKRVNLMKVLAECIERLHAVNWLHKGLRSENVLFFYNRSLGAEHYEVSLSDPFLSGFMYSRPESADYMSENPHSIGAEDFYRHPAVQGGGPRDGTRGGYKKSHDIYSFGVVLLEIAYWRPVYRVLGYKNPHQVRPLEISEVRNELLSEVVRKDLRHLAGDAIADVVVDCIKGPSALRAKEVGNGSEDRVGDMKLQESFYESVVKKLMGLCI